MRTLWQDAIYAFRLFRKNPGFTAVVVIAIGLGIGANTTIFSSVDALLLRPFSFPNQERLVMIWERHPEVGIRRGSVAPGNLTDWREQNRTLQDLVAIGNRNFDLKAGDRPEQYTGHEVSAGFFDALGVPAFLGRTFNSGDGEPDRNQVVVLKHSLWERRFGAHRDIIGQQVSLGGKSYTVIGVMPKDFNFPYGGGELWAPFNFSLEEKVNRGNHYLRVMGLLKPGVTVEQADADLRAISLRAQTRYPETNSGRTAFASSLSADFTRGSRMYLPVLIGAVGFVLLIACANVANLLLARAGTREKEIAVRLALGAGRGRIIRQLLTESVILALLGGMLGLALSFWGIEALADGIPREMSKYVPGWDRLSVNRLVFAYTLAISVLTGMFFGLAPALQATRLNFNEALKEGGKGSGGKASRNRMRSVLVVAEVALSLILLISAGLMVRSFIRILRTDFGVDPENVVTLKVAIPDGKDMVNEQRVNHYTQIISRVESLPGVAAVGAVDLLPFGGSSSSSGLQIVGQPPFPPATRPNVDVRIATPGYFNAVGTGLHRGRVFNQQDNREAGRVALVNQAFAGRFFPGRDAVGQRILLGGDQSWEIIGIVSNVMNDDLDDPAEPGVYLPYAQSPSRSMRLVIRGLSDPVRLVPQVRGEIAAIDPDQPIAEIKTLHEAINERSSPKKVMTWMLGIFALIALVLATVGIFAVMSYVVSQRTHEIGVRMALGARSHDILRLIVGQGVTLTLIGLAIGLVGSYAMTRALAQMLYGVTPTDPLTFAGISLLLAVTAALACYVPARRAMKVDPMVALRYE